MNCLKTRTVLGLFMIGLLGSSALVGTYATRSQSNPSQVEQSSLNFRFENYNSAEATKGALTTLFPPGTQLEKFNGFMKELKAECDGTSEWTFCYYYTDPKTQASQEWSVMAEADNGQITALKVSYFDHDPENAKQAKGYKGFRFEDYETAEAAKEKLMALFPTGTEANTFVEFMKNVGARCDEGERSKTGGKFVGCDYIVGTSLLSGIHWYLVADFNKEQKITNLEVYRHPSAL